MDPIYFPDRSEAVLARALLLLSGPGNKLDPIYFPDRSEAVLARALVLLSGPGNKLNPIYGPYLFPGPLRGGSGPGISAPERSGK